MKHRVHAMEVFIDLVDAADWSELSLQLLLFACAYLERRELDPSASPRTPEEYVQLGLEDGAAGVYGFDRQGKSLFLFFAAAVASRIDRDIDMPRRPASRPGKSAPLEPR